MLHERGRDQPHVRCSHVTRRQRCQLQSSPRSKLRIHPLEDRVVIRRSTSRMRGGRLYIPDTAKEKPTQGEVLAVGPGRFEKGKRVKMEVWGG